MLYRSAWVLVCLSLALASGQWEQDDDGGSQDPWRPRYHFIPEPLGWMNDPNGLFYDPVFQKYHLMYQYLTPRVWGHAVSDDLVHWTQLPVALENDMWYDKGGVYTGSATVLNDEFQTPMLSYSVSTNNMQCLAFPTNRSDPNLVLWTKFSGNPIISSSTGAPDGRDDTTAWLSSDSSHWLMAYGIINEAIVYTTPVGVYANWTQVGPLYSTNTGQWECPDFYPLPKPAGNVTSVVKASTEGRDYWVTGFYNEDNVSFTPIAGTQMGLASQLYDYGVYYASKRFFDPSTNRQILFGWVIDMAGTGHNDPYSTTWASTQSLPRSVSLDVDGQSLLIEPVVELQSLRMMSSLKQTRNITIAPHSSVPLTDIEGQQLEIIATFQFDAAFQPNCGINVLVDTLGQQESTAIGFTLQDTTYMVGTDLPGNDYSVVPENYTDPHICQAACDADPSCEAWTFVIPGGPPGAERCCLKSPVPAEVQDAYCVSGVKGGANITSVYINAANSSTNASITKNNYSGALRGVQNQITLHIFVDHSVVEVYTNAGQGSTVITNRVYPMLPTSVGVSAFSLSGAACNLVSLEAWELAQA